MLAKINYKLVTCENKIGLRYNNPDGRCIFNKMVACAKNAIIMFTIELTSFHGRTNFLIQNSLSSAVSK